MFTRLLRLGTVVCLLLALPAPAATLYVDLNSPGPAIPYATWATAANRIQDAVDVSSPGDLILVTNGVYQNGGWPVAPSLLTNRVAVTNAITIQSVNGPGATVIAGNPTNGDGAVRCVFLTNGATLIGFTLTNGATRSTGNQLTEEAGGGVWGSSFASVVSNCVIINNQSVFRGGGAYQCTLKNCSILGNTSASGGGVVGCTLNNCAVAKNGASVAGGAGSSTLSNCTVNLNTTISANGSAAGVVSCSLFNSIVWSNTTTGQVLSNYSGTTFSYCDIAPLFSGTGNISADPKFVDYYHLGSTSPCLGAGSATFVSGTDLDGEAWHSPPAMGCDEYYAGGALTVAISTAYTNVTAGFSATMMSQAVGSQSGNIWNFGDGSGATNVLPVAHTWSNPGDYIVVLTAYNADHPGGVSGALAMHVVAQPVHYVDANSVNPVAPYSSWATAANRIQDAVDAASTLGALVLVTNGSYSTGGRTSPPFLITNRVLVNKPVMVQSVNGPAVTRIVARPNGGPTVAARCVYLTNGATLIGFTLTTGSIFGSATNDMSGGGAFCYDASAVLSNCIVLSNVAILGGGVYGGTLYGCLISSNGLLGNSGVKGGGACNSILNGCTLSGNTGSLGGGAYGCSLANCSIASNTLSGGGIATGGGVYSCILNNCTLTGNSASYGGGGAYGSTLSNCVVSGNLVTTTQGESFGPHGGGGVENSQLYFCMLSSNSSVGYGGGSFGGNVNNCLLTGNLAFSGGGAYGGTLQGCLIVSNAVLPNSSGGGATIATLNNCTVMMNYIIPTNFPPNGASCGVLNCICLNTIVCSNFTATSSSGIYAVNYSGGSFSNSCTVPLPAGVGNISADPIFVDLYHLSPASPCRGAGSTAYTNGTDIDGEAWLNPPSIGCDEYYPGGVLTVSSAAAFTNFAAGFGAYFTSQTFGSRSATQWNFGDGTEASNVTAALHSWMVPGDYTVVFTAWNTDHLGGVSSTLNVHVVAQPVLYVDVNGANPSSPFSSWATAATNIQDAVDAASVVWSLVLVTNGIYTNGGRVVPPYALTNRVAVTIPLVLQSINGPGATIIQGNPVVGNSAIRCVYLTDLASLTGFTLTNGATRNSGNSFNELGGGGILGASVNVFVTNCVISGNSAANLGGGALNGTYFNCTLKGNSAQFGGGSASSTLANIFLNGCSISGNSASYEGGGAEGGVLNNCNLIGNVASSYGGGIDSGTLNNCLVVSNTATFGGGADYSIMNNCLLWGNLAHMYGGGSYVGTLINCTITGNSAGNFGGGISDDANGMIVNSIFAPKLTNCILYNNLPGDYVIFHNPPITSYCSIPPLQPSVIGVGNITNAPVFVDAANGNFRLQSNSPCINAGNNALAALGVDLDGNARISGGTVDMGAYEFQNPASQLSYAWLQKFGLATDGSADFVDSDGDGMSNFAEWRAGTNPTNSASLLELVNPAVNGTNLVVTWQSVTNVNYYLQRSLGLQPAAFLPLATNIAGLTGTTSYTDTNAPAPGPWFYRVGVQ